jgi:flagellar hook-length control protein FliK
MQKNILINLLLNQLNIKNLSKTKKLNKQIQKNEFITEIFKKLSPKEFIYVIKKLNLSQKDIQNLISQLPITTQTKKLILENSDFSKQITEKKKNSKLEKNKKLINNSDTTLLLKKENISVSFTQIKKDVINEISKKKIKQSVLQQIKNSSSLNELIQIANKNGLNIKKILIKTTKSEKQNPKQKIPYTKNPTTFQYLQIKKDKNKKTNKNEDNPFIIKQNSSKILKKLLKEDHKEIGQTHHQITLFKNHIPSPPIQTLKHFSTKLKEAIENYTPPINKLQIELNPKYLGKVDITLIQRGDNLQIHITSNNNVINFFHIHQTELKNTLINMGYSGIDMNFNFNQNSNQNKQQRNYKFYNQKEENNELIIKLPYTYA